MLARKALKCKTSDFHPLRSLWAQNLFVKKMNWLEIVLITSFYCTTYDNKKNPFFMDARKHDEYQHNNQKWFSRFMSLKSWENSIQIPVKSSFCGKVRLWLFFWLNVEFEVNFEKQPSRCDLNNRFSQNW